MIINTLKKCRGCGKSLLEEYDSFYSCGKCGYHVCESCYQGKECPSCSTTLYYVDRPRPDLPPGTIIKY